jgi:hypothetical protein
MGQIAWSWSAMASVPGTLRPTPPPVSLRRLTPDVLQLIPQRLIALERVNRAVLSRKAWQVFLLIDGSRTVSQLVTLLLRSPSSEDVQEFLRVLNELEQQGFIALVGT